jgi:putative nucleotidyltransferase with HDIG domain
MEREISEEILRVFPAISQIQDPVVRDQVLRSWARAVKELKETGFGKLEEVPFSPDIPECSLPQHIDWVLEAALLMAELAESRTGIKVNRDLLIASVLLHDLGKAFEYERHAEKYGRSEIGKKFMHGFWGAHVALEEGVSRELAHLISTHTQVSPVHPQTVEGVILHYADYAHADLLRMQKGMALFLAKK